MFAIAAAAPFLVRRTEAPKRGAGVSRTLPAERLISPHLSTGARPERTDAELARAVALYDKKQYAEARDLLQSMVARQPQNAAACSLLGLVWLRLGDAAQARALCDRAVQLDARSFTALDHLAFVCVAQRDYEGALRAYAAMQRLDSKSMHVLCNLVNVAELAGDKTLIAPTLQLWLRHFPRDWYPYTLLATQQRAAGQLAQTEETYRVLLQIRRRSGPESYRLGLILLERGRPDDAAELLTTAIELMASGDEPPQHVIPTSTQALEQLADARLTLADIRLRQGRREEAAALARQVLDMRTTPPVAKRARSILEK